MQGIGFDDMVRHQLEVADIIAQGSGHRRAFNVNVGPIGTDRRAMQNSGRISIDLKPRAERKLSVDQTIVAELRPKLAQVPGVRVYMINQPPINLGGGSRARAASISSRCRTPTPTSCTSWRRSSRRRCGNMPGLEDVSSDLQIKNPQVDRQIWTATRSSALGLTVNQVETALYNAYGTRQVSQIYAPNNQYQVILQVAPEFQQAIRRRLSLLLRAPSDRRAA